MFKYYLNSSVYLLEGVKGRNLNLVTLQTAQEQILSVLIISVFGLVTAALGLCDWRIDEEYILIGQSKLRFKMYSQYILRSYKPSPAVTCKTYLVTDDAHFSFLDLNSSQINQVFNLFLALPLEQPFTGTSGLYAVWAGS